MIPTGTARTSLPHDTGFCQVTDLTLTSAGFYSTPLTYHTSWLNGTVWCWKWTVTLTITDRERALDHIVPAQEMTQMGNSEVYFFTEYTAPLCYCSQIILN